MKRFIEQPAAKLGEEQTQGLTASGPPLPVLLRSLEVLRDLRVAADRRDIATRHHDLARLRAAVAAAMSDEGGLARLKELIDSIRVGLLTTVDLDGITAHPSHRDAAM